MINSSSFSLNGSLSLNKDELFSNILLEIKLNQWTVIIGQSGTGKSTLLKIIANLNIPAAFNNNISKNINEDLSFSWMAQNDLLLPWLNVSDNITLGQKLRREKIDINKTNILLEKVGLIDVAKQLPATLSGGMRQRAALARTLMENNDMILMDEPFSSLDTITKSKIQKLTWSLLKNKTVIMVTHDPLEALMLSNTLYYVSNKKLKPIKLPSSKPLRKITNDNLIYSYKYILNLLKKSYI
ncbi:MAG: ABC transporter ATP-binding protein [Pelagibacterales bacterium]|mgnify:FL=1|jgi:putative hydroxymethylpyrimidine transport system ATP-binding protein|nr:ABC transporter ATP-binding protein [Pelagibacterales bacterium]MBT4108745.1 ABC transporter ATP-binding protein [Pelagibacterales bacterium]